MNGVFTTEAEAEKGKDRLRRRLEPLNIENIEYANGYNPSHLGGAGDLMQSVSQAFANPISDYDLKTILLQIHPQVKTRKILLVGHSQGTFYTNELYDYLTAHGVPRESIAVYNLATPASFVAGGGRYITSSNDKVINRVRDTAVEANARAHTDSYYVLGGIVSSALRANETIPKESGWEGDEWGGHMFSVYLDGATARITRDIGSALEGLRAGEGATVEDGCFEPPRAGVAYALTDAFYRLADPYVAHAMQDTASAAHVATSIAHAAYGGIAGLFGGNASQTASAAQALSGVPGSESQLADPGAVPQPVTGGSDVHSDTHLQADAPSPVTTDQVAGPTADAVHPDDQGSFEPVGIPQQVLFPVQPGFGGGGLSVPVHSGAETPKTDAPGNGEPPVEDTVPPGIPAISISACEASLSASSCVVVAGDVHISWEAAEDAAEYAIAVDGVPAARITGTSGVISAADHAAMSVAVVAYDETGNAATSSAVLLAARSHPIVINEVGWGGDADAPEHQWIELRNLSDIDIDLSHVRVGRSGGDPIPLTGLIPAFGYAVVLPSDIPFMGANRVIVPFAPFALDGEQFGLILGGSSAPLDLTPAVGACPSAWCEGTAFNAQFGESAGFQHTYRARSMERVDGTIDGTLASSWQTTDSYGPWIGNNQPWWGTPGYANSENLPEAGVVCNEAGLLTDGAAYDPGTAGCVYYMRFITPSSNHAAALYRGDVGSSTPVAGHFFARAVAGHGSTAVPSDAAEGERFFFAMWEQRVADAFNDTPAFESFFTSGASPGAPVTQPPHGNYVVIPFIYHHRQ